MICVGVLVVVLEYLFEALKKVMSMGCVNQREEKSCFIVLHHWSDI